MPIRLTSYQEPNLCVGHVWEIVDEDLLVEIVAHVMLGKQRHVKKILEGTTGRAVNYRENAVNNAINKLTVEPGADPWHRDGLIFQVFSWLVANLASNQSSIIRPPHLIPAQKGFDGLQVDIDSVSNNVSAVVIFEDKATTSPRVTIREQVWPEFANFYSGDRESELEQEITTLLETRKDLIQDVDAAIETLIWDKVRKFRVAITADAGHMDSPGRRRLFNDYDLTIPEDDVDYRRGELVHINNLRDWMEDFSQRVIQLLEARLARDV